MNYIPVPASAAPAASASSSTLPSPARVDVTVNRILTLVQRAQAWSDPDANAGPVPSFHADADECTDSESEPEGDDDGDEEHDHTEVLYFEDVPPRGPSAGRDVGASGSPDHDRPLAHTDHRAPVDASEAGPSVPPQASRSRPRSRSPSEPHRPRKRRRRLREGRKATRTHREAYTDPDTPRDPGARFEKELLSEVTCEICFGLLLQPITTPCQHVSISAPHFYD